MGEIKKKSKPSKSLNNESFAQSFMQQISTGASTDSDIRVITIDSKGEMVKFYPKDDLEADDSVPKFKKPIPSRQQNKN